jgi:diguanylate cyclase (GGDEF)-like protein
MDHWLARGRHRLNPIFAPVLEARYEADTSTLTCEELITFGKVAFVAILLMHLNMLAMVRSAWLFWLVSAAMTSAVMGGALRLWRRDPPRFWRESLAVIFNAVPALFLTIIFVRGYWPNQVVYALDMITVTTAAATVMSFRLPWAVLQSAVALVMFWVGLKLSAAADFQSIVQIVIAAVPIAAWHIYAGWRNEVGRRRAYLMRLHHLLGSQDLSIKNRELADLTRRDALTGLANRRGYDAWMENAWQASVEAGQQLGVIMIDIDKFKDYNDFYGHPAGDMCLAKIARTLRDQLRGTSDCIARLGGEEFVALLDGVSEEECGDIAERLRVAIEALQLPHLGVGTKAIVTISLGVAVTVPVADRSPHALLGAADEALYDAKHGGRNRVSIGSLPSPEVEAEERLFFETAAKSAARALQGREG